MLRVMVGRQGSSSVIVLGIATIGFGDADGIGCGQPRTTENERRWGDGTTSSSEVALVRKNNT